MAIAIPTIVKAASLIAQWWSSMSTAAKVWFVVKVAATVAAVAYSSSQSRKAKRALAAALAGKGTSITSKEATASRLVIYGRQKVGGTVVFIHATGDKGQYLHVVVAHCTHEVHALDELYFGDELVELDGSGNAVGKYAGFVRCKSHLGTDDQTADADLVSETGGYWSTDHRLRGIAYSYIRFKYDADKFPSGLPQVARIIRGKKLYDPRDGSTAYSTNSALALRDYLSNASYGLGCSASEVDSALAIPAAANICDEDVTLADASTEKRYTTNGAVDTASTPSEIITQLSEAMAGWSIYSQGVWKIFAGAHQATAATFTIGDIMGPITVQSADSMADACNGVKGVYVSEANQWQVADFPPITNSTYTAEDQGNRLWREVEYPFTSSAATAQRLAKIELERSRQGITVQLVTSLVGLKVQAGDVVAMTIARYGWTAKLFEVVDWEFSVSNSDTAPTLGIALTLRETSAGVWDWASGEETTVDLAPNTNLPDPWTVAAPTGLTLTSGSSTVVIQPDGTVVPRLKVEWTAPADAFVQSGGKVRIQVKTTAAPDWSDWNVVSGDQVFDYITDVRAGTAYYVRVRGENALGVLSAWVTSSSHTVTADSTAPAAPSSLAATVGTGKAVSLDWADNTEADLGEYQVFRSSTGSGSGFSKLAEVRASRFVDTDVAIGTQYWYYVTAVDRSENVSAASSVVTATPTAVAAGAVDATAPSTPSAPTFNSESTYQTGDGNTFAQITVNCPSMPTLGEMLNILYRVAGSGSWIVADQRDTGGGTARIDDLSPGVAYEFGAQAWSAFAVASAVSSVLSRTAPNKSSAPNNATGVAIYAPSSTRPVPPQYDNAAGQLLAASVEFTASTSPDVAYYEFYFHTSDTTAPTGAGRKVLTSPFYVYTSAFTPSYLWHRAVDRTGNASAYAYSGYNLNAYASLAAGTMSSQNVNNVAVSAVKIGASGASSIRQVVARYPFRVDVTLGADAYEPSFNIDLTNRGFTAKPTTAAGCISVTSDGGILGRYDYADAGNSSTNAVVKLRRCNDSQDVLAGTYTLAGEFIQYA